MTRPVIGIIGNLSIVGDRYPIHGGGQLNSEAISQVSGCIPLVVPADPELLSIEELCEICDGFLLTGGRANVHPEEYGHEVTEKHGEFDRARDAIALGLVRRCVETGQPFFGICRGFQEVNVAMGGTLDPEIRELPGRQNHRMPRDGDLAHSFTNRHIVRFTPGGHFAQLYGAEEVETNSLHGQGIREPGPRIVVEGYAPDGTAEALRVRDAPGFTLSVQWHPEWRAAEDPVSRPLFEAFGDAARDWAAGRRPAARVA
ncbi:gamma-glutamyl-gamma-aminobutyrate hydrolase family protein [Thioclava sp. BHET1]|uniref:gamma-glutamyl-gamma-aminobutyrate hydrolase n=1 Tax=Thioclava dalianensis TaxID=1185766 RepID=A0A074TLL2_9RHOB|nr:gamma-glutamyl-gamma-aminobutyrate hydrolase family protein [Thioclava dalianensis]KEP71065.1 glutamine amidotransferase [Thioclava dalianensis]TMV93173.1 gamma-glutamyl-gamma-aminobutyrate hydrolase family protein [Thioclava sp. BHET1]SFN25623.1 putative glutamine amidotransferase [Thioclava dalianensis]